MREPLRAAGVVPFRIGEDGLRVLLLRSSAHGAWGFPKGHLDPGESEADAARREFLEETGLGAYRAVPGFRASISYRVETPGGPFDKVASYFLGEAGAGDVRISAEHDRWDWFPPQAAMERLTFENLRRVLARAVARIWLASGHRARPFETVEPLPHGDASALLASLGSGLDPWIRHSARVGEVSGALAGSLVRAGRLDGTLFPFGAGLLHDVGRALDHGRHGWEGYRLLDGLGLPAYARVAGVHWLKGRTPAQLREDGFREEDRIRELDAAGLLGPLRLEEKVVCVADALVAGDRIVSMEGRFRLARERYGDTPWMRRNEALSLAWQEEFESWIGRPLLEAIGPDPDRR